MSGHGVALTVYPLRAGWVARIRGPYEPGSPHLVCIDETVAARCRFMRWRWDDADVRCPVFRDPETDEFYYQRGNGEPPYVVEYYDIDEVQVELCPIELVLEGQPIPSSGKTVGGTPSAPPQLYLIECSSPPSKRRGSGTLG